MSIAYRRFKQQPRTALNELLYFRKRLLIEQKYNFPQPFVKIGDYTYGKPIIHTWDDKTNLTIGKYCSIAEGVIFMLGGNHRTDWVSTYPFNAVLKHFSYIVGHPQSNGDIIVGNDVWIGAHAKIMSGVTIGHGAVVAANALVTKDVPPYCIVGGVPAKVIRKRFSDDVIQKLLSIAWWDWDEATICEAIPMLQSGNIEAFIKFHEQ